MSAALPSEIPILIAGGGTVGLTLSLLLSRFGVPSLLVERHPGTAMLPKARSINARSMEIFRQIGVEEDIRANSPEGFAGTTIWVESLAGKEIARRHSSRAQTASAAASSVRGALCSQDLLEPVLRRHAEKQPAGALRFNVELTDFSIDADGVTAMLRDRVDGTPHIVRARYLVAADGARSPVRERLGLKRTGRPNIYDSVNIHCRADLRALVVHRPASLYYVEQPTLRGTFLTIDGGTRWGFLIHSLTQYGFTPETLTPDRCVAMIRQAAGLPDLAVEVLGISFWQASAMVTERFRVGSVFLAGDAAHETTPSGGFGMNIGIQDAQNLAWKLAAVLGGQAAPALLDSYEAERLPAAQLTVQATLDNMLSLGRTEKQDKAQLPRAQYLNELGLIFGILYDSAAVVPDGTPVPRIDDPVTQYVASARPGARAPHLSLERGGKEVSTIDLFGGGFVLLAGPQGEAWRAAAQAQQGIVPLALVLGQDVHDPGGGWTEAYGADPDGAVLVRPDGYVGWRCPALPKAPAAALRHALDRLLGREA